MFHSSLHDIFVRKDILWTMPLLLLNLVSGDMSKGVVTHWLSYTHKVISDMSFCCNKKCLKGMKIVCYDTKCDYPLGDILHEIRQFYLQITFCLYFAMLVPSKWSSHRNVKIPSFMNYWIPSNNITFERQPLLQYTHYNDFMVFVILKALMSFLWNKKF